MKISEGAETIKKNKTFRKALSSPRRADSLMTCAVRLNGGKTHRLGVTVSKKVDKRAVRRNLIKRRVKAAFAEAASRLDAPFLDVCVILKPEAAAASYAGLSRSLASLLKKHGFHKATGL